jgi:arylsulfatase A-like enzyme
MSLRADARMGDHGFSFMSRWPTAHENPNPEPYRAPFMIYNPRINNPDKRILTTNVYGAAIPTTILDLMTYTKSFSQVAQQELASRFAANYEHAQSFLRPIKEVLRMFFVNPGGTSWVVDNGKNLRVTVLKAGLMVGQVWNK